MDFPLNEDEVACVKDFAERFERGEMWVTHSIPNDPNGAPDPLELPPDKREAILSVMEHMGVIADVSHVVGLQFFIFRITPKATQIAREICKQEPRDIVEHVKTIARRSRILAWAIIVFSALTGLMIFVNQLLQLLKTLKVLKPN